MKYKLESIKRKKEFEFLFEFGKRISDGSLRTVVLQKNEYELQTQPEKVFYAVFVSKKTSKKAVVRNKIKRLLRESLRLLAKNDMNDRLKIFKYIFLNWISAPQRPCEIHLKDVIPSVQKALSKAYFLFVSKEEEGKS